MHGYLGLRTEVAGVKEWLYITDEEWDDADAAVVCRENGYPYGKAYIGSTFWSWYTNVYKYITRVNCTGDEAKLTECDYDQVDTFIHSNDGKWIAAGVLCHHEQSLPGITY